MSRTDHDAGGATSAWFVKIVLLLTFVTVVIIDGGAFVVSRMGTSDAAKEAGRAAADLINGSGVGPAGVQAAYDEAQRIARIKGGNVRKDDFLVYPDGRVQLTYEREPNSFLIDRLPGVKERLIAKSTVVMQRSYL